MIQCIFFMVPIAVTAIDLSFPPRPDNPKLIRSSDYNRVKSVGNDYVINNFIGLVSRHGYPAEEHRVTTDDGYHINFHRIPGTPINPKKKGKPILFIQHGLLSSSDIWVIMGPNKDLAFLAADAGFDVWIGNVRGNTYGRSHVKLSPDRDPQFWQYSYHDIGLHDIPAMIDYILQLTGEKSLVYIGHSQGTTASYVLLSTKPEYNSKIRLLISLSPVTYWMHGLPSVGSIAIKYVDKIKKILEDNNLYEILPQSPINVILGKNFCGDKSPAQPFCIATLFQLFGVNVNQLNTTILSTLLKHNPAGASVQCLLHFAQNIVRGTFQAYDYGRASKNMEMYNRTKPPHYNLKNVNTSVALFYGRGDVLSAEAEAVKLSKYISNLVAMESVPDDNFNHMDFIFAIDVKELLYDLVIFNTPLVNYISISSTKEKGYVIFVCFGQEAVPK